MIRYTYEPAEVPAGLAERLGVSPFAAEILFRRGIDSPEKLAGLRGLDPAPALAALRGLPGAAEAAELLAGTLAAGRPIAVYHDYDADGVCAAAIALEVLSALGGDVFPYANRRDGDGYGMSEGGVDALLALRPETGLILTVDNGVSAAPAVAYAKERGVPTLITDHHEPPAELPDTVIVDPKCTGSAETQLFCGAAVALGVMLALCDRLGRGGSTALACTDLAALATIADSVPLLGYNRALVRNGLERMRAGTRAAFFALQVTCGLSEPVTAEDLAYKYAPMLNAPSRVTGDCSPALALLRSRDDDTALRLAGELAGLNEQRKALGDAQSTAALDLAAENTAPCHILFHESFTEGIIGIAAGRVFERTGLPTVLLARHTPGGIPDGTLRGSCRGPAGTGFVSIFETLHREGLVSVYGGHDQAAGFTALESDLPLLRDRLTALLPAALPVETQCCDASLSPSQVTLELIRELERFAPFGEGFPPFTVELRGFRTASVRWLGNTGAHARLTEAGGLSAVFWNCDRHEPLDVLCRGRALHGSLGLNRWNGRTTPEFTAVCEYAGGPLRFGCTNGETVEAVDVSGDTVELRYKGALHRRPLRDVGRTLLPLAEQPGEGPDSSSDSSGRCL